MSAFLIDNKLVFIHIPKTGGASIRKGYLAKIKQSDACRGYLPKEWLDFPSIAIVRHPLDRFISAYHMLVDGYSSEGKTGRYAICKDLTIEEFSERVLRCRDPGDGKHGDHVIAEHTLPQTHKYNLLRRSKMIFKYEEEYQSAIDWIAYQLNIKLADPPRWNTTRRKHWSEYNIPESILGYYLKDFTRLGYEY